MRPVEFFLPGQVYRLQERRHRRLTVAVTTRVRPLTVVPRRPDVQIRLQLLDGLVEPLAEGHRIELLLHRLVKALAHAVGLRPPHLRPAVVNVLGSQVQLVLVVLPVATVFRPPVG